MPISAHRTGSETKLLTRGVSAFDVVLLSAVSKQKRKHVISLVFNMDKVCMLIAMKVLEGGISCTGQRPLHRGVTCEAMQFTFYADYTMTSSSALKTVRFRLCLIKIGWLLHK